MKHLPTDFLRALTTIAETGNFTKAGERLGRSQSAISLQIKKLEDITQQTLFIRQGHNFQLTPQGHTLVAYARQILALNDQVLDEFNPKALSGNIRLGIPSEFATSVLPKALGEFSRSHPQVSLEVSCDLSRNLRKDFLDNQYDLIFALTLLNDNKQEHRQLSDNLIRIDNLAWVGANRFQWQQIKQQGQEVSLIVAPEGCLYRQQATHWLEATQTPWRIAYTIVEISGIQAALEEGIGITVLPQTSIPDSLSPIPMEKKQPSLGKIGMELLINPRSKTLAISKLADSIKQALT